MTREDLNRLIEDIRLNCVGPLYRLDCEEVYARLEVLDELTCTLLDDVNELLDRESMCSRCGGD